MQAGRDPNDRDRHHDPEMIRTHPIITSPPSQMRIVRISDILGAWRNDSDGTGGDGELRELHGDDLQTTRRPLMMFIYRRSGALRCGGVWSPP
jgi:hypothetical protein